MARILISTVGRARDDSIVRRVPVAYCVVLCSIIRSTRVMSGHRFAVGGSGAFE